MTQIVTRVDDRLAAEVDRLVAEGRFASRSDAVRQALEEVVDRCRRAAEGQLIADAYRRQPQTAEESGWSDAATRAMIAEEPW